MEKLDPYAYLCCKDRRNPHWDQEEEEPRKNCFCDNCFYGRDRLALEIIRLRELLK